MADNEKTIEENFKKIQDMFNAPMNAYNNLLDTVSKMMPKGNVKKCNICISETETELESITSSFFGFRKRVTLEKSISKKMARITAYPQINGGITLEFEDPEAAKLFFNSLK